MVSGNKNYSESAAYAPMKNHPVVLVLEKYLIKYFHELMEKDVRSLSKFSFKSLFFFKIGWKHGRMEKI